LGGVAANDNSACSSELLCWLLGQSVKKPGILWVKSSYFAAGEHLAL